MCVVKGRAERELWYQCGVEAGVCDITFYMDVYIKERTELEATRENLMLG